MPPNPKLLPLPQLDNLPKVKYKDKANKDNKVRDKDNKVKAVETEEDVVDPEEDVVDVVVKDVAKVAVKDVAKDAVKVNVVKVNKVNVKVDAVKVVVEVVVEEEELTPLLETPPKLLPLTPPPRAPLLLKLLHLPQPLLPLSLPTETNPPPLAPDVVDVVVPDANVVEKEELRELSTRYPLRTSTVVQ